MRPGFAPWVGKMPWRRKRLPTPVFWPGEFHGLYSPWGRKELDTTGRPHFTCVCGSHFFHTLFRCDLSQDADDGSLWRAAGMSFDAVCPSLPLLIPTSLSTLPSPSSPLATTGLLSLSVSLFLFWRKVHLCCALDSTCKQCRPIFVLLCLTDFTQDDHLWVHPCSCRWHCCLLFYDE